MKTNTLAKKKKLVGENLTNQNRNSLLTDSDQTKNRTTQKNNGAKAANKLRVEQLTHFPDPFDQKTSIVFKLDHPTCVSLIVYNADTNGMTYLACGPHHEGYHKVDFDASNLPAGIYIARLRTDLGVEKIFMTKLGSKIPNKPN
jgi:hypothetical protein